MGEVSGLDQVGNRLLRGQGEGEGEGGLWDPCLPGL